MIVFQEEEGKGGGREGEEQAAHANASQDAFSWYCKRLSEWMDG